MRYRLEISRLVLAASACLTLACVMGGGSDQPNKISAVRGNLQGGESQSVAGARVTLWKGGYLPGHDAAIAPSGARAVDTSAADTAGAFHLLAREEGEYFVEARSKDSLAIAVTASFRVDPEKAVTRDLRLSDAALLSGSLTSASTVLSVHLAGTHFETIVDDTGAYRFGPLPPGDYWLIARLSGSAGEGYFPVKAVSLQAGKLLDLPRLRVEEDRIALFDFESGDNFSGLRGLTYPYDQPAGSKVGAWKLQPFAAITDSGAYRGKSAHASMKGGEFLGFAMGEGYHDLTAMDAFSFQAKGRGRVVVIFHSNLVVEPDISLRATITLDTAWKWYDIRPADIIAPPGSSSEQKGYTFGKARNKIAKITFEAEDPDAEIFLDDLAFEGMNFRDLGPSSPAGSDTFP